VNSLGFDQDPKDTRIVVAMSGGVDSSVAAALMVEAGYDVIGMTMQLYDHGVMAAKKGACCAGQDIYDARQVCDKLGISHYVLDYESRFSQTVIEDFADSYMRGETPVPCIQCNQKVKFQDLLTTAKNLGAQCLVTGHYVRREGGLRGSHLMRAVDHNRDQSYFLFATTQNQLDYLRFPLGGMPKSETRAHALRFGLDVADKPDSQDICFVPDGNYADIVSKLRPGALESGPIVHIDGRILGQHKGIINYTIGQRKGLGISSPNPLYVIKLDPQTHTVIVGPHEALATQTIRLRDVNWLGGISIPAQVGGPSGQSTFSDGVFAEAEGSSGQSTFSDVVSAQAGSYGAISSDVIPAQAGIQAALPHQRMVSNNENPSLTPRMPSLRGGQTTSVAIQEMSFQQKRESSLKNMMDPCLRRDDKEGGAITLDIEASEKKHSITLDIEANPDRGTNNDNIHSEKRHSFTLDIEAKVRSTRDAIPARLTLHPDGTAQIQFSTPEYGVSPGQACVFYQDNRVLGGGWIC